MPDDKKTRTYKAAGEYVAAAMHERKHGKLHSGSDTGPKVKSRAQAIAIGLSEQRKSGQDDQVLGDSGPGMSAKYAHAGAPNPADFRWNRNRNQQGGRLVHGFGTQTPMALAKVSGQDNAILGVTSGRSGGHAGRGMF
jgi:hypothetical protein